MSPDRPFWFGSADGKHAVKWAAPSTKEEFAERCALMGVKFSPNIHPDCVGRHDPPLDVAYSIYSRTDYRTGKPAPYIVLKGSRGLSGKSTLLATVTTMEGLEGLSSTLLGGSLQQSRRVHEISAKIWERTIIRDGVVFERGLRHLVEDPTVNETVFFTGARRRALTASQTSVRGPHQPRTRLDEVDEMDLDIFEATLGQAGSEGLLEDGEPIGEDLNTQTTMSSTHQHATGTFTEVLKRARERDWPMYEFCWRDCLRTEDRYSGEDLWAGTHYGAAERDLAAQLDGLEGGWLTLDLAVEKRLGVSVMTWKTEYELGEPSPESRAFDTHLLSIKAFPLWLHSTDGVPSGREGDYIEFPCCAAYNGTPCLSHSYATGADWGRDVDWTIISTYRTDDFHPVTGRPVWRLVAWERHGRRPWPEILPRFDVRLGRYPGVAAHDATGMGGKMAGDFITGDNILHVSLNGAVRDLVFKDYGVALEMGEILSPRIAYAYDEHRFCTIKDLQSGGRALGGHPPDSVVAAALAWYCRYDMPSTGYTVGGDEQRSPLDGVR